MTFEEFATAQLASWLRLATALAGDRELGQDLVHDLVLKVHARWGQVSQERDPAAYARRMLVNEHLSWRRKWSRVTPVELPDVGEREPDPATALVERDALRRLLATLPRKQQTVLALRFVLDLGDAEVAEAMGISVGTVRGYASRALATLRAAAEPTHDGSLP